MFAGKRRMMRERNAKVFGLLMICFFNLLIKNGFDLFLGSYILKFGRLSLRKAFIKILYHHRPLGPEDKRVSQNYPLSELDKLAYIHHQLFFLYFQNGKMLFLLK